MLTNLGVAADSPCNVDTPATLCKPDNAIDSDSDSIYLKSTIQLARAQPTCVFVNQKPKTSDFSIALSKIIFFV